MIGHDESTPTNSLIGVGICIAGNTCISLALNIQKLAHNRLTPSPSASTSSERSPLLADLPRPAPLQTSVSDPDLRQSGAVLVPAPNAELLQPSPPNALPKPKPKRCSSRPQLHTSTSSKSTRQRTSSRDSKGRKRPRTDKGYLREPLWWLGISLMSLGEFGNFLSYSFAPASLVAPLGSVALVANVALAPLIVREPFRRQDLFGCFLAFLGGATVVYASKASDQKLYPDELLHALSQPLFIVYASVSIAAIIVLVRLSATQWGDKWVMVDLGICALSGGFTVLSTKAFSSLLTLLFLDTFRYPIVYPILLVLISTAFVQVNFINKALQRFESRVVVPCQFMSFALSTIVGSAVLYREFDDVDLPSFLNFAFGCVLSGAGVYLLTRSPAASENSSSTSPVSAKPSISLDASDPIATRPLLLVPSSPHLHARARKLSLTLGGTQYLLAHSPAKSTSGRSARSKGRREDSSDEDEEVGIEEAEEEGDERV